jgi:hypothetical protein
MSIRIDPPSRSPHPRSSGSPFASAAVLCLLGALLCVGGATLTVVTEFQTWHQTWF